MDQKIDLPKAKFMVRFKAVDGKNKPVTGQFTSDRELTDEEVWEFVKNEYYSQLKNDHHAKLLHCLTFPVDKQAGLS